MSWAGIDEDARQGLLTQSVISSNGSHAPGFAAEVGRLLTEESVDGSEIWDGWLRAHLTDRLNGVPRSATPEELIRWADTVPHLGDGMREAVDLLSGHGIGFGDGWLSVDLPVDTVRTHGASLIGT